MAKTWKQRMVKEAAKLNAKLEELDSYLEGDHGEFDKLDEPDRDLLMTQHSAMTSYSNILEFVDFINFFLPPIVNLQIIFGRPKEQKSFRLLPVKRWTGNEWLFYEEDFKM